MDEAAVSTPAGWYPDPQQAATLRYWDGTTWTMHRAPGPLPLVTAPKIRPGLVGVWITAILSLFTFYFRSVDGSGDVTTIAIPIGIVFMIICWSLVSRAKRCAELMGIEMPGAYRAARITSGVLAGLSVLSSLLATFG
jgi:hypothetical protein